MSSLNNIRMPDGTELNLSEWLHWPLYSTIEIGATDALRLEAFSYVRGSSVPRTASLAVRQATDSDTNMVRRRKMNQDEALVVFAVTYEAFGLEDEVTPASPSLVAAPAPLVSGTTLRSLQRDTVAELLVGAGIKKPQVEVPFSYIGQSIGQSMSSSGDFASISVGTAGCAIPSNQRKLELPVYIGGFGENARPGNTMKFSLRHRSQGALSLGASLRIRWWLDGLRKRPA